MRLLILASVAAFPLFTWATTLPVVNPSFEVLPPGGLANPNPAGAYSFGPIPGWTCSNNSNCGQFQPTEGTFNTLDDGPTSAWVRQNSTIFQTIAGWVVQAGNEYTLSVDVGWRNDKGTNASVDLLINGIRYLATGPALVQGDWATYTVNYIGTAADAGSSITIELNATSMANNTQGNYDNVRLTDPAAVPEPALAGVVGAGVLALIGCGLRKRRC